MSKLIDTRRAYEAITKLVDAEILKKSSNMRDLQRFQEDLDVAFYLLGWARFEHLVRDEAKDRIEGYARSTTLDGRAWKYVQQKIKDFPLRKKLDVIFHSDAKTLAELNDDYDVRNDAAHNYARLPREARDISAWLRGLEDLVDKF